MDLFWDLLAWAAYGVGYAVGFLALHWPIGLMLVAVLGALLVWRRKALA